MNSAHNDNPSKSEMYGAPFAELRFGNIVRTYERVKLALIIVVLILNLATGAYLVSMARTNQGTLTKTKASLVILECAVDPSIRTTNGKPSTIEQYQKGLDACIRRGGPRVP